MKNLNQVEKVNNFVRAEVILPADVKKCTKLMLLVERYELCNFLVKKFEETNKDAIELKSNRLYHAYRQMITIVNSKGENGSISKKKLDAFAKMLGFEIDKKVTTVYEVKSIAQKKEKKISTQSIENQ